MHIFILLSDTEKTGVVLVLLLKQIFKVAHAILMRLNNWWKLQPTFIKFWHFSESL